MAFAVIEGLLHHTGQRCPVMVEHYGLRNVDDFEVCCVDTRANFIIRSSTGSPHCVFIDPVEVHQERAPNCKICCDVASFPGRPPPRASRSVWQLEGMESTEEFHD